jgi:hypothetical protein
MAEVTFTLKVTQRVAVPSALIHPEIVLMASRAESQVSARKILLQMLQAARVCVVDVRVARDDSLHGETPDLGVGLFRKDQEDWQVFFPWDSPLTFQTDEAYEQSTGRKAPKKPKQQSLFLLKKDLT